MGGRTENQERTAMARKQKKAAKPAQKAKTRAPARKVVAKKAAAKKAAPKKSGLTRRSRA